MYYTGIYAALRTSLRWARSYATVSYPTCVMNQMCRCLKRSAVYILFHTCAAPHGRRIQYRSNPCIPGTTVPCDKGSR